MKTRNAPVHLQLVLPPELDTPRAARALLRSALIEAQQEQWRDQGELALSEVISNAVLHAGTPITLTISVNTERLHVEVCDESPHLPEPRRYSSDATTGRGLELVELLTTRNGTTRNGNGKSVWFQIRDDTTPADALQQIPEARRPDDGTRIQLLELPAPLWRTSEEHHATLIREYTLEQANGEKIPGRLRDAERAERRLTEAIRAALQHGTTLRVDVEVQIPDSERAQFQQLADVLEEAERAAEEGELLSHAAAPEIRALHRWCIREVLAQLDGAPPRAHPTTAQQAHS